MKRPNILYLHSHDTGRYISPYGHAISTPNLQKLAENGVTFRNAFCAAPTCSPSRAALLTGQSAHSSGMLGLAHRGWCLNDYSQHILHTLRPHGYVSALCGIQHIAAGPDSVKIIGYDQFVESGGVRVANVVPAAAEWIKNQPPETPWYFEVGFVETHTLPNARPDSLFGHEPGDSRYVQVPAPLPDTPRVRQDMADYIVAAQELDRGIGEVLQAIKDAGQWENTIIISTTDHGMPLPRLKCNLTDHGMGVMLIMRGPDWENGLVSDALVSQIDLFPTLCDSLQIERPSWLQGESLLPLLRGEKAEIHDAIFGEVTYHAAYQPQRAVRTQRYKYIRQFAERDRPVLPNIDDSRSKEVLFDAGFADSSVPREQLFDLIFDPNEANNLAENSSYASVLEEMRERLEKWMKDTDDPILNGPVPSPSGDEEKNLDDYSPGGSQGLKPINTWAD